MSNLKLGVEVISARLGDGVSSFAELRFDDQKVKTTTKLDDSSPVWNERFSFNISDTEDLSNLVLEAYVYNKTSNVTTSCLGKIRILGTAFVPYSEAVGVHYPLEKEKWSVFSFGSTVRGELTLKVFVTDNPSVKIPTPNPRKKLASNTSHSLHNIPASEKTKPRLRKTQQPPQPQTLSPQQQMLSPQPLQPHTLSTQQQMLSPQPSKPQTLSPQPQTLFPQQPPVMEAAPFQPVKYGSPVLGGGVRARTTITAHDLVEPMEYL